MRKRGKSSEAMYLQMYILFVEIFYSNIYKFIINVRCFLLKSIFHSCKIIVNTTPSKDWPSFSLLKVSMICSPIKHKVYMWFKTVVENKIKQQF